MSGKFHGPDFPMHQRLTEECCTGAYIFSEVNRVNEIFGFEPSVEWGQGRRTALAGRKNNAD